jgi:hypothetical protein
MEISISFETSPIAARVTQPRTMEMDDMLDEHCGDTSLLFEDHYLFFDQTTDRNPSLLRREVLL